MNFPRIIGLLYMGLGSLWLISGIVALMTGIKGVFNLFALLLIFLGFKLWKRSETAQAWVILLAGFITLCAAFGLIEVIIQKDWKQLSIGTGIWLILGLPGLLFLLPRISRQFIKVVPYSERESSDATEGNQNTTK